MATSPLESDSTSNKMEASNEIKGGAFSDPENVPVVGESSELDPMAIPTYMISNKWQRWANKIGGNSGAEARGIERVDDALRTGMNTARDYFKMTEIWFSVNLTVSSSGFQKDVDEGS
jgi:hypothetical protein